MDCFRFDLLKSVGKGGREGGGAALNLLSTADT